MSITKRDIRIIKMLSQGKTAQKIGELMRMSHRTVEGEALKIKKKLRAANVAHLVAKSLRTKLIK
jgi:DNA-binding CsgD family transcriptional regulator